MSAHLDYKGILPFLTLKVYRIHYNNNKEHIAFGMNDQDVEFIFVYFLF